MFFKIWHNSKNFRLPIAIVLIVILLDALLAAFSISLIMPIASAALEEENAFWGAKYIPEEYRSDIPTLLIFVAVILFLKFLVTLLNIVLSAVISERIRKKWQERMARQYLHMQYAQIANQRRGTIVNNMIKETRTASNFIFTYLSYISQIFIILAVVSLLASINFKWLVVMTAIALFAWFVLARPYFRFGRKLGQEGITLDQGLNSVFFESINGIKDIKISNSENFQIHKIDILIQSVYRNKIYKKISQGVPNIGGAFILSAIVLFAALILPKDPQTLQSMMPQMAVFIVAAARIILSAATLATLKFKVVSKLPAFLLITDILKEQETVQEEHLNGKSLANINDDICFKNVGFSYADGTKVFNDLNMTVKKGAVTCISGPSGMGKTTMIDLLSRLYEPSAGAISVANENIQNFNLKNWRGLIGYVSQEPILYYGSVRENISLGRDNIKDEDIKKACELACASEFVEELSDGYETMLSEGANNLSGGQKKRLAIARAIAQNFNVMILDETTGAIQEKDEKKLINNLKSIDSLTLIIISHRSSTVELADVCYHIENGQAERIKG